MLNLRYTFIDELPLYYESKACRFFSTCVGHDIDLIEGIVAIEFLLGLPVSIKEDIKSINFNMIINTVKVFAIGVVVHLNYETFTATGL